MEISTRKQGSVQVVRVKGPLRLGPDVDEFKATLHSLIQQGETNLVVVLHDVPMMDSSGIGALIRSQTDCREQGGEIKLASLNKFVEHSLKVVKILEQFDVHHEESLAVAAFGED